MLDLRAPSGLFVLCSLLLLSSSPAAQNGDQKIILTGKGSGPAQGRIPRLKKTVPAHGTLGVPTDRRTSLFFSHPLDPDSVVAGGILVDGFPTGLTPDDAFSFSQTPTFQAGGKVVTIEYPSLLPPQCEILVYVNGDVLRTTSGLAVDADGDGQPGGQRVVTFSTATQPEVPVETDSAMILGTISLDEVPFMPPDWTMLATVDVYYFPRTPGDPPLSGATQFELDPVDSSLATFARITPPFTDTESFLVCVTLDGYSEALAEVTVEAGSCASFGEARLSPLTPPTTVDIAVGATLDDPDGNSQGETVSLDIPGGALPEDPESPDGLQDVAVTVLDGEEYLREELPSNVGADGSFVDVEGVFGEVLNQGELVTMRFPNKYGLAIGKKVPFGKVDHNTLEWSDLRDLYQGEPWFGTDPDVGMGEVKSDGMGGSYIEVQFDHFCTICTGYCLKITEALNNFFSSLTSTNRTSQVSNSCGNSVINLREGYLWEDIEVLSFQEFGRPFSIGLGYFSGAANPTATLQLEIDPVSTRPIEYTTFEFDVLGKKVKGTYDSSAGGQHIIGTYLWDGVDGLGMRRTGSWPYSIRATTFNADSEESADELEIHLTSEFNGEPEENTGVPWPGIVPQESEHVEGRATILDFQDSPYGAGWSILNEKRIYSTPHGDQLLVSGNGDWLFFERDIVCYDCSPPSKGGVAVTPSPPAAGSGIPISCSYLGAFTCFEVAGFVSPPGELSTLKIENSGWRRIWPDGSFEVYNSEGRLIIARDAFGNETTYSYAGGRLSRITSPTGFEFFIDYDGSGKLQRIHDSTGREALFMVDAAGDLVEYTNAVGDVRTFDYETDTHLLIQQTGSRGEYSTYEYQNGRCVAANAYDTTARGGGLLRRRTFEPSVLNGEIGLGKDAGLGGSPSTPLPVIDARLDRRVDGRGIVALHETDERGQTIRTVDGLGNETRYEYDDNGYLSRRIRPDGSATEYEYAGFQGQPTTVREMFLDTQGLPTVTYSEAFFEYDPAGVVSAIDAEGGVTQFNRTGTGLLVETVDDEGNVTRLDYSDPSFPQMPTRVIYPDGEAVLLGYDERGNVESVTDFPAPISAPSGRPNRFLRNDVGEIATSIAPGGEESSFTYDDLGRVTSTLDANSAQVTIQYTEECGCGSTEAPSQVTFADPGQSTMTWQYDGLGRLVEEMDQLGNSTHYSYDQESNLTWVLDRNGELTSFEYDLIGRMTKRILHSGAEETFVFDSGSRLLEAVNDAGVLRFAYDALGRLLESRSVLALAGRGETEYVLSYGYDRNGSRTSVSDNLGLYSATLTYDGLQQVESLAAVIGSESLSFGFTYDGAGRRKLVTYGDQGLSASYDYDPAGQLESIAYSSSPSLVFSYSDYTPSGDVGAESTLLGLAASTREFGYTPARQLDAVEDSARQGESLVQVTTVVGGANRVTSDSEFTYEYDAEGRLTSQQDVARGLARDFTYDSAGRLTRIQESTVGPMPVVVLDVHYMYDALGRRVHEAVNGVTSAFTYDAFDVLLESDASGRLTAQYVHGPREDNPLAEVKGEHVRYLLSDRLGSIRAHADSVGSVSQVVDYDEFGRPVAGQGEIGRYAFTGREWDAGTGLYYYRARYLDPFQGRFLSEDPIGLLAGPSLYAYVANNPANLVDSSGAVAIAAAGGAITSVMLASGGGPLTLASFMRHALVGAAAGAAGALFVVAALPATAVGAAATIGVWLGGASIALATKGAIDAVLAATPWFDTPKYTPDGILSPFLKIPKALKAGIPDAGNEDSDFPIGGQCVPGGAQ